VNVAKNRAPHSRRPQPLPPPSYNSVYRSDPASLCRLLPRPGRSGRSLSDLHETPVTSHKSRPLRNPFRIRSYRNSARNSFRMRSYRNYPGGSGAPALDQSDFMFCAGANTDPVGTANLIPIFTIHQSRVTSHAYSCACALFFSLALFFSPRSFVFNNFQPLFQKHPGWHTPTRSSRTSQVHHSRVTPFAFSHESQVTSHAVL
jgi:hypothetical protein